MAKKTPVGMFGKRERGISPLGWVLRGAAAGAAGTTALNAVTYLDMAVRGRGSSSTPEQTVEKLAEKAHVPIPGQGETRQHRIQGLGPLTGLAAGVGMGVVVGLVRAAGFRTQPLVGKALTTRGDAPSPTPPSPPPASGRTPARARPARGARRPRCPRR